MSDTTIINIPTEVVHTTCIRKCACCKNTISSQCYLSWELMDFCNESCISKYQGVGLKCRNCSKVMSHTLFGRYYIRIKNVFRVFCTITCKENYQSALKICSYCQENISSNISVIESIIEPYFNAPVSFCSQLCLSKFNSILKKNTLNVPPNTKCSVCKLEKSIEIVLTHNGTFYFCTKRCLIAYSFVNIPKGTGECIMCHFYYSLNVLEKHTVFYEKALLAFCSTMCQHIYILLHGTLVSCKWCHHKRCNFGMIRKHSTDSILPDIDLCSVNCLRLYLASRLEINMNSNMQNMNQIQPLSSAVCLRNLLSEEEPLGNKIKKHSTSIVLSSGNVIRKSPNSNKAFNNNPSSSTQKHQVQLSTGKPSQRNVATMCCIPKADKETLTVPSTLSQIVQTDNAKLTEVIMPIPLPIYIPAPMAMFSVPVPTPVPFPVPIPVPLFIPISQKSEGIMEEINNTQSRMPSDPCQAELLKIADAIANEKVIYNINETVNIFENELDSYINLNDFYLNTEWELNHNICYEITSSGPILEKDNRTYFNNPVIDDRRCEKNQYRPKTSNDKLHLKYIFGIIAWNQWKRAKKQESDILYMLPHEINLDLCSFIEECKKPNGSNYAPDTIYYLCLGIQHYLNENKRTEDIFSDQAFDKFTDRLDQLALRFCELYNARSECIITRVEEEHLWQTQQLGCHSPQVLINTLIYFNTKYYGCFTVDQHMELSFFHILKAWKKKEKRRSLVLRFHPKISKTNRKCVYEQCENESDHFRCPVRLYEFYLTKCPESMKSRQDIFYLQPERYCIGDSPLWYTSSPLKQRYLSKTINRVKMVKEINVALLNNN